MRIATGVDRTVSDPTAQEPIHTDGKKGKKRAVDFTASWRAEAAVPLFAIEQFEEKTRR